MLKVVSVEQMKALDKKTIEGHFVSGFDLMDRAGKGLSEIVAREYEKMKTSRHILLFAGKGNNGGDVFAASRYLRKSKIPHATVVFSSEDTLSGDALSHFRLLKKKNRFPVFFTEDLDKISGIILDLSPCIIVDGLLGTGFSGKLKENYKSLIALLNGSNSLKIAVDVPSGMDANTGRGFSFLSDVTVTMGLPKIGMFLSIEGQKKCGKIIPVDIGFPKELVEEVRSRVFFIEKNDICRFISKKPVISHKGDFGRPLLIAGSDAYPGALILCAGAALKANAGVITALASEKLRNILLTYYPEVTYKVIKHNATISNYLRISINFSQYSSIGFGPGICNNKDHSQSLSFLFNKFSGKPLIIDADGINILAQNLSLLRKNSLKHVVLTPHPKEFSRLSGFSLNEILKDRMTCIQQFSRKYRVFIVLKGYNSLISTPEGSLFVNSSGNPCLSTAGTGDVLTGILSAFSGFKDKELIDAIISSVYIHGLAGDLILQEKGSYGITASDIIEKIPQAINSILR